MIASLLPHLIRNATFGQCFVILKRTPLASLSNRFYRITSTNDPIALTAGDLGRLYQVSNEDIDTLYYRYMLPPKFRKQVETLNECVWLYRQPTLEATACLKLAGINIPNLRVVLWGRWGTGKSMTVYQTIYHVWKQGWVLFTIPNVMTIMRDYDEVKPSTYHEGRIDFPLLGHQILRRFKLMNTRNWEKLKECKAQKHYKWSKVEETKEGEPITNIVDIGLSAPSLSSDCVGGLLRELTHHCSAGRFPLLVTIDHANSLYGKTTMKDKNHKLVDPKYFTLIHHLRKLLRIDWTNGACLLVADKREVSDARDHLTVPLETPLELFGEDIEKVEPFIPIETPLYTFEEMDTLYDYYLEKNWIASESGRTERAKKELKFLSGRNPYYYERICAFV
uniref:Small ribosomal subunit protein mS29 n=1 Tax=Wuchereria bancrofti TaxID=6293 RepID=A0AAF5Q3D1_WUCBA